MSMDFATLSMNCLRQSAVHQSHLHVQESQFLWLQLDSNLQLERSLLLPLSSSELDHKCLVQISHSIKWELSTHSDALLLPSVTTSGTSSLPSTMELKSLAMTTTSNQPSINTSHTSALAMRMPTTLLSSSEVTLPQTLWCLHALRLLNNKQQISQTEILPTQPQLHDFLC